MCRPALLVAGLTMLALPAAADSLGQTGGRSLLKVQRAQTSAAVVLATTPLPRALRLVDRTVRAAAGRALLPNADYPLQVKLGSQGMSIEGNRITYQASCGAIMTQNVTLWNDEGTTGQRLSCAVGAHRGRTIVDRASEDWRNPDVMTQKQARAYHVASALTTSSGLTLPAGSWVVAESGERTRWGRGVGQRNETTSLPARYSLWQWQDGRRVRTAISQADYQAVAGE
jgi:hypothetical protein